MQISHRFQYLLKVSLLAVLALALVSCSGDEPLAPAGNGDEITIDTVWQDARADLERQIGDAALMEEIAPALDRARDSLDDTALKHGGRFLLSFTTTVVQVVPPFPPPSAHLLIDYVGFGTILGHHTGFSDSYVDITVVPQVQTSVSYYTDAHGDQLDWDSIGPAENSEDGLTATFSGNMTFTGGTGRYDGASGSARYYGQADNVAQTGWVLTWGWVNLAD